MLRTRFFKISLLAVYLIVSLVMTAPSAEETKIVIFHINDIHAKIDNLPKIAWYVQQERKKNENVFFLNAGDNFTGNPVSDLNNPKGQPVRELLNLMHIDAMTLGNHDFDHGQEILKRFIKEANFPTICANIKVPENSVMPQPEPFVLLKTGNGIEIALLGVIEVDKSNNIPSTLPGNVKGLAFFDPIETVKKYTYLKKPGNIFILLSHIGFDEDMLVTGLMPQLDVIIGGHSHTPLQDSPMVKGILIAQAGGNGSNLGRVELTVKDGKIVEKSGKLIPVSSIKNEDPKLREIVDKYNNNPALKQVVADLSHKVRGHDELGHLITDGLCSRQHLDIAFHADGGIRASYLGREVTIKDVYTLHPFSNVIVKFNMTPAEIRSLIAFDFTLRKRRSLKVSGLQYTIRRTTDFKVKDIILKTPEGKPLDENKTYLVGMNNYIASAFTFDHKDPGQTIMVTLAENLVDYLKENQGKKDVCQDLGKLRTFESIIPDASMVKIGELAGNLSTGDNLYSGSSGPGNLMADAIRWSTKTDIATFPSNGVRYGFILPDNDKSFYKEYISGLYLFTSENKAVVASIKGADFKRFLLDRCRFIGNADLQVSGMSYTLLLNSKGDVTGIECRLPDGKEIQDESTYKVAFNDYMFKKSYKLKDKVSDISTTSDSLGTILENYIKQIKTIPSTISEKRIVLKTGS